MNLCVDESKKYDVGKYKGMLSMALGGPIRVETKIIHDNGKSCFETEFEIIKKS